MFAEKKPVSRNKDENQDSVEDKEKIKDNGHCVTVRGKVEDCKDGAGKRVVPSINLMESQSGSQLNSPSDIPYLHNSTITATDTVKPEPSVTPINASRVAEMKHFSRVKTETKIRLEIWES